MDVDVTAGRRWVDGEDLAAVWRSSAPVDMEEDLANFGADLTDPFER